MARHYDVVVVGARCAGSPLATHLSRAGLSVALIDRAAFPSETASTHFFQVEGVASLARLGVLDHILDSGAPMLEQIDLRIGDMRLGTPIPFSPDDRGPGLCVRRQVLDASLVDAARDAGAEVRTSTRVIGLVERGGRVAGVRVATGSHEEELRASLVVGADGTGSTVGRLVGARKYNQIPNRRFTHWAYYEGARWEQPATLVFHRWREEFVIAAPVDSGLYMVVGVPPLGRLPAFRSDAEASWRSLVTACDPVDTAIAGARQVGRFRSVVSYPSFFRESAGAGWVLVGDAGHFKDPAPGQGISDALRQVERLAPAIVEGLGGADLDTAMARWCRWRDRDAAEMHWFASDLGKAGTLSAPVSEMLRPLARDPELLRAWVDILNHRIAPSDVLTPARLLSATARLLRTGAHSRGDVMRDTWRLVAEQVRRKWLNRHPSFVGDAEPRREGAAQPSASVVDVSA